MSGGMDDSEIKQRIEHVRTVTEDTNRRVCNLENRQNELYDIAKRNYWHVNGIWAIIGSVGTSIGFFGKQIFLWMKRIIS